MNQALPDMNQTLSNVNQKTQPLSQYEINERVNRIISGGRIRK